MPNATSENVKMRSIVSMCKYRNDEMVKWVNGTFTTDAERSAAWATFAHVCNEYPDAGVFLRGRLVESDVQVG